MQYRRVQFRRVPVVALALASVLALSACGSRVSGEEVLAGAGGGTVRLDDASIAELRTAAADTPAAPSSAEETAAESSTTAADAPPAGASTGVVNAKPGAPGTPAAAKGAKAALPAAKKGTTTTTATTAQPGSPAQCTGPGVPLKLGQIGSFSGVTGPITANARTALAAWAQDVNARGGIACHPVELFAVDDGGDPARGSALVAQLVQDKKVQALVGTFDALGFKGILTAAEKAKIPLVGGDGIDFAWNESPYAFPTGAGILGAIRGALKQTIASGKLNLGLLYCVEASVCTNGAKVIRAEVAKTRATLTYSSAISLTQPDFTAQCQAAKSAGVQGLGVAMDGASIGRVARSCASVDYHPQFLTNGLVLSAQNAEDPAIRKNTLSSASSVAPWTELDTPGQREYHAALKKYAPSSEPSAASIYAWAAGKLLELVAGIGTDAESKAITTADVMTGLGKVSNETLGGLIPPMTFRPGQKSAPLIECVYFTLLTEKGWTAPRGSKPVCT